MSLETLLDALLVPQVPATKSTGEPQATASNKARSPSSLCSPKTNSKRNEALARACEGLPITPAEVRNALAPEDIGDWRKGDISTDALVAFARSVAQRRDMDQGKIPDHYTERATCEQCGPVWLWFSDEVLGCPWCWNRTEGRPIPRP